MSQEVQVLEDPQGNYKKGYIKLYRSIDDHWINSNPYYFQAFARLIMKTNHADNSLLIEGEIIECKRGQAVYSLNSWVDIFNNRLTKRYWTIQKVRTFLKLLAKDLMIELEGLRKTTRVTICNYDSYQAVQHRDNTEITQSQHGANTELTTTKGIKNIKGIKKNENIIEKNFIFYQNQIDENKNSELKKQYNQIIEYIKGKNDLGRPLDEILMFPDQLTYKQFEKLWNKSRNKQFTFKETLMTITNKKDYWHKKISLYLTINGWINRSADK